MSNFEQPPVEHVNEQAPEKEDQVEKWSKKLEELGFVDPREFAESKKKTLGGKVRDFLYSPSEESGPAPAIRLWEAKSNEQKVKIIELASALTEPTDFDGLAEAVKKYESGSFQSPFSLSGQVYAQAIVHAKADLLWLRRVAATLKGPSPLIRRRLELHPDDPDTLELAGDFDYLEWHRRDEAEEKWTKALQLLQAKAGVGGFRDAVPSERIQELYRKLDDLQKTRELKKERSRLRRGKTE